MNITLAAGEPTRAYTASEKQHMLKNLELEVEDRTNKFRQQINDTVAAFVVRSENEVIKVPRVVRSMTLEEFARFGGDVRRAVHAQVKERLDAIPNPPAPPQSVKKRRWPDADAPRASKAARLQSSPVKQLPSKKAGVAAALNRTPKTPRIIRGPAHTSSTAAFPSPMHPRAPSIAHFNPALPKTPAFPKGQGAVLRRKPSFMPVTASGNTSKTTMALVSVPTKDGQVIELDPLSASPSSIDALEGISDSAKKQAKDEMARLVQSALAKWTIT